jgi:hydroxyacylglutathione hydrolase
MIHEILPVGALQCNCSIFGDEQTREGIVIDPGDNIPEILAIVKRHGLTVKAIVITHATSITSAAPTSCGRPRARRFT